MTYEQYRLVFLSAAVLGMLLLAVAVLLFFVWDIRKVIGDLTGANAKKAVARIRQQNQPRGRYAAPVVRERTGITERIRVVEETTVLNQEETTVLNQGETTVLEREESSFAYDGEQEDFSVLYEITYVHTNETAE